MGSPNGYSRRASKEKQIFALDFLVSKHIPGIQMTFPPVTLPAPCLPLPLKRKAPAGAWEWWSPPRPLGWSTWKSSSRDA